MTYGFNIHLLYPTINEQIWKIAQNYTANFINESKSSLSLAHWNRYRYCSCWIISCIRWYLFSKKHDSFAPVTHIWYASDISSQYRRIPWQNVSCSCPEPVYPSTFRKMLRFATGIQQDRISSVDNDTAVLRKARNAFGFPNAFSE